MVFLSAGCTQTQLWQKTGGNQQSFNLDSIECEFIAKQIALQQSETGKTVDPVIFNKAHLECLGAKGWSRKIADAGSTKESGSEQLKQLAQLIKPNIIKGFGQTISVPYTYKLAANKQFQIGPTIINQFFWKGDDSSFINIFFQENVAASFERISYPVSEPYVQYTSGEGNKAEEKLQWTTFFGNIDPNWIMGIGAYYYAGKKQRIIIVITKPLVKAEDRPPEDVILAENQFKQIEEFSEQWQTWLDQQFQEGPGFLGQLKGLLRFGI